MTAPDNAFWETRYQQGQTGWDRGKTSPNLIYWLENKLLVPCRIIVPGCGNGYEVVTLAEQGFDVTAIDIAPSPLAKLQTLLDKKQLSASLIQQDFFDYQPEQAFDVIFEQTSLCALSPEQWNAYGALMHQWLNEGGQYLAAFMQTGEAGGPPYHCSLETMQTVFSEAHWVWSQQYIQTTMGNGDKQELLYRLEKI